MAVALAGEWPAALSDCSIGWFVDSWTGECVAARCGRWSCVTCGPRKVRALAARFRRDARKYNRFITLTISGRGDATRETLLRMSNCWRKLYFRLKREYGLADYAWVHEQGSQRGRVHKHLVVRSDYIPQARLSLLADDCGCGPVVDIRAIRGRLGMNSYLTKYLVKDAARGAWPRYARRVQHTLSPEPPRADVGRWLFMKKPQWTRRRREEPETRLPEELALEPECQPTLFPRPPNRFRSAFEL